MSVFTDDDKERVKYPMFEMMVNYFPDAFAALAKLCFDSNEKHNPGEPLHWARDKSSDHKNKCMRHVMDQDWPEVAWRALAQLQLDEEKRKGTGPDAILNRNDPNRCHPDQAEMFNQDAIVAKKTCGLCSRWRECKEAHSFDQAPCDLFDLTDNVRHMIGNKSDDKAKGS